MPETLNAANFWARIKAESGGAVAVVMFHRTSGCDHCAIMRPVFREFAEENPGVRCFFYELGERPDAVTGKLPIKNFPTFIGFKDGLNVSHAEGTQPSAKLTKLAEMSAPSGVPLSEASHEELVSIAEAVAAELRRRKKAK